jgi:zinc transport system permease protein
MELFQFEFFRNALFAGVLVSIACAIIGTYVVINRIVFISGGIAHAAYGGIGLGVFLGINPVLGAVVFSIAAALGMGSVSYKTKQRIDTLIGVMWAVGMAIGIIFADLSKGYTAGLMSYLFGSILTLSGTDLFLMGGLDILVVFMTILFYKQWLSISFDPEFSEIMGLPVKRYYLLLLCLTALTVVVVMRMVGIIMVIALLTIPPAIANRYFTSLKKIMAFAILLGALFTLVGMFISFYLNLTSGAMIILVAGVSYFISLMITPNKKRKRTLIH